MRVDRRIKFFARRAQLRGLKPVKVVFHFIRAFDDSLLQLQVFPNSDFDLFLRLGSEFTGNEAILLNNRTDERVGPDLEPQEFLSLLTDEVASSLRLGYSRKCVRAFQGAAAPVSPGSSAR